MTWQKKWRKEQDTPLQERIDSGEVYPMNLEDAPGHRQGQDSHEDLFGGRASRMARQAAGIKVPADDKARKDTDKGYRRQQMLPANPDYVVSLKVPGWGYKADDISKAVEELGGFVSDPFVRVFRREGQRMTLDVAETITWMRPNLAHYDLVSRLVDIIESEADFDNMDNQRILQEMFQRTNAGGTLIPGTPFVPYAGDKKDARAYHAPPRPLKVIVEGEVAAVPVPEGTEEQADLNIH